MDANTQDSDLPPRSSLTSLRPSIYEHVEEHGRTYHAYKSGSTWFLRLWEDDLLTALRVSIAK